VTLYLNVTLKVSLDVAVLFFELIHRVEYGWVGMVPLEDFGEPSTRQMVILDMSLTVWQSAIYMTIHVRLWTLTCKYVPIDITKVIWLAKFDVVISI